MKNPHNPLPVEIIEFNTSRRYELSDFEGYRADVEEVSGEIEVILEEIPDRFWRILQEDEKFKVTWEGERKDLHDESRSGQNGKRPFIADRQVCDAVVRDLKEKGRFLQVEGGLCYWFDDAEKRESIGHRLPHYDAKNSVLYVYAGGDIGV